MKLFCNPNYNSWPANALHKGPAYVNKLVWSYILNPTTRYGSLTSGESDVIYDVPAPDYKAAQSQYNVAQKHPPRRATELDRPERRSRGVHGCARPPGLRLRANRKQAVESAFDGKLPFNGNGSLGYDSVDYDSSLNNAFAYDPAKANQLLNEAGWTGRNSEGYRTKDGKVLTVKVVYVPGSLIPEEGVTMLQDLQQQWKQVGFDVQLTPKTLAQAGGGELSKPTTYDAFASSEWCSYTPAILEDPLALLGLKDRTKRQQQLVLRQREARQSDPDRRRLLRPHGSEHELHQGTGNRRQPGARSWALTHRRRRSRGRSDLHDVWIAPAQSEPIFADAYFTK